MDKEKSDDSNAKWPQPYLTTLESHKYHIQKGWHRNWIWKYWPRTIILFMFTANTAIMLKNSITAVIWFVVPQMILVFTALVLIILLLVQIWRWRIMLLIKILWIYIDYLYWMLLWWRCLVIIHHCHLRITIFLSSKPNDTNIFAKPGPLITISKGVE